MKLQFAQVPADKPGTHDEDSMLSRPAEQEDWRRKYYDSLRAVEQEARQGRAQLETLYRLVGRLCLAAQGQSPQLDAELRRLKDAVRANVPVEQVEPMSKAIADAVHAMDAPPASKATTSVKAQVAFDPEATDVSAAAAAAAAAVPTAPAAVSAMPVASVPASRDTESHPLESSTQAALTQLLSEVSREPQFAEAAGAIAADLAGPMAEDRKLHLIEKVAALVMQRIADLEKSRRELEVLLGQMLGQLDSFTRYIAGQGAEENQRKDSSATLNLQITGEMRAIGESMQSAADLEQMREQMNTRLNAIGQHLHMYRLREEERARQSRERNESLRVRMDEMESEARKLQARLSSEKRLSLLDPLTRIPNRLAWDQRFAAECARWRRFRQPTCVLAWDIDRFKNINDGYGHRAGDKVLAVVAESLSKSIRGTDFVARYGGEEFVMLLPGTSLADGEKLANRMREAVAQIGFHFRGNPVGVTISCGITALRDGDDDGDAFDRADKAMYKAKESGRNRVVSV